MNENEQNTGGEEKQQENVQQEQHRQQEQESQAGGSSQVVVEKDNDARLWGMLVHLAGLAGFCFPLVGNVVLTLIFWELKRHEYDFVDRQGKEALNFQISMSIYGLIAFALTFACVGVLLLPVVAIIDVVLLLIAAVRAHNGIEYRYPLTFRLVR